MEKGISDWDRVHQICSKIWLTWETATGKAFKCLKSLQEIFESDRWQIHKSWWCHIAVGISPSRVHFILKRFWKNERLLPDTAYIDRWPKKRVRVQTVACNWWFPNSIKDKLRILLLVTKHGFILSNQYEKLETNGL